MDKQTGFVVRGEPVGVGGWLLLLCLGLTVFSPLMTIVNLSSSYQKVSPLFRQFPGLYTVSVVDFVLNAGVMCFSIYAGVGLWKKKQGAVHIAKRYLMTFLLYTVVASVLPFMAGLPSEANEAMIAELFKDGFRSLLFFAIWYSYLNKSRRVKNTFPSS
jgi:hypothetical protein